MAAIYLIGTFLPYLTCIVFLLGIARRIDKWNKAKSVKMTLFPAPDTPREKWARILKEILVFRGLYEGNKPLWVGAWGFHVALALILLGHAQAVTDFPLLWRTLGVGDIEVDSISAFMGGTVGLLLIVVGGYLLLRRLSVVRVREISDVQDFLGLFLVLSVIISGDILRFGTRFDLKQSREYLSALLTLRAAPVPSHPLFLIHFFLGQILIMYIPFSKFLHIPGIFYSKSLLYQK